MLAPALQEANCSIHSTVTFEPDSAKYDAREHAIVHCSFF